MSPGFLFLDVQRHFSPFQVMEGSTHSSMYKKAFSYGESSAASGESGWTKYFEEFLGSERRKETRGCSSYGAPYGSSTVSDAVPCVLAWKSKNHVQESESYRKLSSNKRRKTIGILDDDPLEDTATSPVSSPKGSDLGKLDSNSKKEAESGDISQVQGFASVNQEILRDMEMNELNGGVNKCTELKERGLCLVSLSMLVDYLG